MQKFQINSENNNFGIFEFLHLDEKMEKLDQRVEEKLEQIMQTQKQFKEDLDVNIHNTTNCLTSISLRF